MAEAVTVSGRIRLVVSDVDGTLVQPDKSLAPSTVAAAGRLRDAGIPLGIVSARPPRGMLWISDQLGLAGLLAGFNGGTIMQPDGTMVAQHTVPPDAVRTALSLFASAGVHAWLFTADEWLVLDPLGPHVDHERHTVRFEERVVDSFAPYVEQAGKVVGVTDDFPLLARLETELQGLLGDNANAKRSQSYYLDVTHKAANKGEAVRALAAHLGVALSDVAVLGDMENDVPMFEVAGFAIAMGNASPAVQARAAAVTGANSDDGWAQAIDRLILPRGS
jgi:Cof subfamily protein (haloacid dehalogenase superfamily)